MTVLGKHDPTGRKWRASKKVEEKQEYEYLSVMVHKSGRWHRWKQQRVERGRSVKGAMWWYGGARSYSLLLATSERLVREMVLPSLTYGGEASAADGVVAGWHGGADVGRVAADVELGR